MNRSAESGNNTPLAIVGVGCHFPGGAHAPDLYWDLLLSGTDATREVPETRWNADRYHDPNPKKVGKMVTRRGGFLDYCCGPPGKPSKTAEYRPKVWPALMSACSSGGSPSTISFFKIKAAPADTASKLIPPPG